MLERMIGAALLKPETYEDVERDESAISQALAVVLIVALASAIGAIGAPIGVLLFSFVAAVVQWALASVVAYYVGTTLFRGPETRVTIGQVLRVLGFAQSPGVLAILGFIPVLGVLIGIILFFWRIATTVVAIRHAFDFDLTKAILTAVVTWIVVLIINVILFGIFFGSYTLRGGLGA